MATKTEETEDNGIDKVREAANEMRDDVGSILDLIEEFVGDQVGDASIRDEFGKDHPVPTTIPMYHEVRGVAAMRRLWKGEGLPKGVKSGAEAAHKQGGTFGLVTFLLEQSVMDPKVAQLIQDVFEGFHGDTPGAPGTPPRPNLLTRLHESARAFYKSEGLNPDHAPTQVSLILRTGQVIASLIPFSRSILKDARDLSTSRVRPPVAEA